MNNFIKKETSILYMGVFYIIGSFSELSYNIKALLIDAFNKKCLKMLFWIIVYFGIYQNGISMAIPMKNGGMSVLKIIIYVILSGIATGVGTLIGGIVGAISTKVIAICLSFAAGAMLYIVSRRINTWSK